MTRLVPKLAVVALATFLVAVPVSATHRPDHGASASSYEQPIWFEWGTTRIIDVVVVPPEHGQVVNGNGVLNGLDPAEATPCGNSYMRAILASIEAWKTAINAYGSTDLKTGLTIRVYTPGCGAPTDLNVDPEIVLTTDQNKAVILGVSVTAGTGHCVIDNSKFFVTSFSYADMYNINAHEFGHCLGLDHTSGPEHNVLFATYEDPIGGANTHFHCIANLNVMGLEVVFGYASGTPSVSTGSYTPTSC